MHVHATPTSALTSDFGDELEDEDDELIVLTKREVFESPLPRDSTSEVLLPDPITAEHALETPVSSANEITQEDAKSAVNTPENAPQRGQSNLILQWVIALLVLLLLGALIIVALALVQLTL